MGSLDGELISLIDFFEFGEKTFFEKNRAKFRRPMKKTGSVLSGWIESVGCKVLKESFSSWFLQVSAWIKKVF